MSVGAAVDLPDRLLAGPRRALARDDDEQQAVLGVDRRVIPVVALVVVGRVVGVAGLLLLGDEVPLLVELDLTGPRGKTAPPPSSRFSAWPPARAM